MNIFYEEALFYLKEANDKVKQLEGKIKDNYAWLGKGNNQAKEFFVKSGFSVNLELIKYQVNYLKKALDLYDKMEDAVEEYRNSYNEYKSSSKIMRRINYEQFKTASYNLRQVFAEINLYLKKIK